MQDMAMTMKGKMTAISYPMNYSLNASGGVDANPGPIYTYSLDAMGGRLQ